MAVKTVIKCKCGHRIGRKEIIRTGWYVRPCGSFVYVKFRCARCKHFGEHFVEEENWDSSFLGNATGELTESEHEKFDGMRPIEVDDIIALHQQLARMDCIDPAASPTHAEDD